MRQFLTREFANPPSCFRSKPFWAWNGKLDPAELRRQIRIMHRMGMGGFLMHSRVGLDTPYLKDEWFECVDACIDEADKLAMEAWLYDEDRWPSGAAGGIVTANPKYRIRSLMMTERSLKDFKWSADTLAAFTARVEGSNVTDVKRLARGNRPRILGKGRRILAFTVVVDKPDSWYNNGTYLDTLNHQAVREFIRVTHETYRKRCGEHFGTVVPGIFSDEPHYGIALRELGPELTGHALSGVSIPWTAKLPSVFRKRYGYDLLKHLPEVFMDIDGQEVTPVRWSYYDCITHLFVDAFGRQVGQWCEKNGLQFTGHLLSEELGRRQARVVGSPMRFYEHMQAPGMDLLTQHSREYDTAKQVSSVARQFGRKWRLSETYGCTGWHFPLSGHKAIGDWQVALGINVRCQHLSWYTMEGEAKRDYPAGIHYQSPWWRHYPKVEDYFARVHAVMTRGAEVRDVLVIHPIESQWILTRRGLGQDQREKMDQMLINLRDSLLAANIDFDYGDEEILSRLGTVTRGTGPKLRVGKACYKAVVVPPLLTMRSSTLRLLKRFHRSGGTVVFTGDTPGYVDAVASEAPEELAAQCTRAPAKGPKLVAAVECARRVSITDADGKEIAATLHLLRSDDEAMYLFVCNTGRDFHKTGRGNLWDEPVHRRTAAFDEVRIRGFGGCKGQPLELDAQTGTVYAARARRRADGWEILTSLPALGSRIFVVPRAKTSAKPPRRRILKDVKVRSLGCGPWDVGLSECNNLVLDRPRLQLGSGKWRKADEILRVDHAIRDSLGMARRGGSMVQPWAQKRSAGSPSAGVSLSYSFEAAVIPSGELYLAIERPGLFDIILNGHTVSVDAETGWWVDRSLRKIPLDSNRLKRGTNEITLTCDYNENHPGLEAIYLLGDFGVRVSGTSTTLIAMPRQLEMGNWCKQGLPFYSGSVCYRKTARVKLSGSQRLFVRLDGYEGSCVRVMAGGREAGVIAWQPNEIDVTDYVTNGRIDLGIEVVSHRRNSHGPLHLPDKHPHWTGPAQFETTGAMWSDDYVLVPCGLTAAPKLVIRQ